MQEFASKKMFFIDESLRITPENNRITRKTDSRKPAQGFF